MKRIVVLFILLMSVNVNVKAGGVIFYSDGEDIEHVITLPYDSRFTFQASDGEYHHFDLGVMHEQFSLFWIPLINYGDKRYVLYTEDVEGSDNDYEYITLSHDDVDLLRMEFGISATPKLPFWDAWGGKLVFLVLIILIFIGFVESN